MVYVQDSIQRFIFEDFPIRGEIVHLDESFQEIMHQHQYPEIIQMVLGETLAAAVLLTESIKFKGQLTIQLQTRGALKLLVAKCNHLRHIRGLAQWEPEATVAEILDSLDQGELVVTIDRDDVVQPYQSIVPLQQKTVTEALEFYFSQSEQLPTKLVIQVSKDSAAGILLQMTPSEKMQDRENFWRYASYLQEDLQENSLMDHSNTDVLQTTFNEENIRIFEPQSVGFRCTCSFFRMQEAIRITGREEALDILKDKPSIVVTCQYCNKEYIYNREEVDQIFQSK